jgi:hypothetical protein
VRKIAPTLTELVDRYPENFADIGLRGAAARELRALLSVYRAAMRADILHSQACRRVGQSKRCSGCDLVRALARLARSTERRGR